MLRIEELPSLKGIAEVIISEGRAGQLILFSMPSRKLWVKWKDYFLQALRNRLNERGEDQFWDVMVANNKASSPLQEIATFLGLPTTAGQQDIFTATGSEPPLIIELFCDGSISLAWQQLIEKTARFFRVFDTRNSNRAVCIFLIAPGATPPVQVDAGLRCYSFWNPLRWEETRLIAGDFVCANENVISRAWQISTYAGAANSDPEVLAMLSRKTPKALAEVRQEILACREVKGRTLNSYGLEKRFFEEMKWDVPRGMVEQWQNGAVMGCTLDRGFVIPWEHIADEYLDSVLNRTIWREQVAGLYPLLLEITFFTSEAITKSMGVKWKSHLSSGENEEAAMEPGKIISIFKENQLGYLPDRIYRLLQQLRFVRNKLAHLEPVDLKDVNQIWTLFDQVRQTN